jgi:hypothetical protein
LNTLCDKDLLTNMLAYYDSYCFDSNFINFYFSYEDLNSERQAYAKPQLATNIGFKCFDLFF